MAGALWLARALERELIVDWREMVFLKDPSINFFAEFFATPEVIEGVPVSYAGSGDLPEYLDEPARVRTITPAETFEVRREPAACPRYLVLSDFHPVERLDPGADRMEQFAFMKAFYRSISLAPPLADELERWYASHMRDRFIVGLNVSTGNGLFAPGARYPARTNTRLLANETTFLRKIRRACSRVTDDLPAFMKADYGIFVATDSPTMQALLRRVPRTLARRTLFPPPGAGRHFSEYERFGGTDREAAAQILIDMFLLARCNALVRNFSHFATLALITNDFFAGNVVNFESLYVRTQLRRLRSRVRLRSRLRELVTIGSA